MSIASTAWSLLKWLGIYRLTANGEYNAAGPVKQRPYARGQYVTDLNSLIIGGFGNYTGFLYVTNKHL